MSKNKTVPLTDEEYEPFILRCIDCMEEVKMRLEIIREFLDNKKTIGYLISDIEFICLQFRKVLELIALANLVSNQELYTKQYANFANHYHAKRILIDLEKINPKFYPVPINYTISRKEGQPGRGKIEYIKNGYLTKEEFIEVYDECAELMHAENPFATPKDINNLKSKFGSWFNKIIVLTNIHLISLESLDKAIWIIMCDETDDEVHAVLFNIIEDETYFNLGI